jgi:hypothetical protein
MLPGYQAHVGEEKIEIPVDPVIVKAVNILVHRANRQVEWALKRGEMKRPDLCTGCGRPFPVFRKRAGQEAHHRTYSPDLRPGQEIDWLCPKCHDDREREIKKAARALLFDKRFIPQAERFGNGFQVKGRRARRG